MSTPIIYSPHKIGLKRNSLDYLFVPLSLSSIVKSNPTADVYFLNVNENYPVSTPGVTDVDATQFYSKACKPIRDCYKHLSTNQADFELFCMERFFVLKEFMAANAIDKAFLVETDVLVFEDLNSFIGCEGGISPEKSYLSESKCISLGYVTLAYLEYYCNYIVSCYCDIEKFTKIESFYHKYREKGGMGGICDMTFCDYINKGMYGADKQFVTSNMTKLITNGNGKEFLFDSFIGRDFVIGIDSKIVMTESYIDNKRIKDVQFESGKPFVSFDNGMKGQLASVHCQGNAKGLMSDFYTRSF